MPKHNNDRLQGTLDLLVLRTLASRGSAVIAATHDVEFAAELADRCVLLARGQVVADGPAREILSGGLYFATEVARVLGGESGAITADEGARVLAPRPASMAAA